ncbi:BRCA2 and CDKN1A-interacting protein [Sorex araneus]|uniref:BRCA2 and CDKN1A-interacting protein n=1 Tax=Sorex araneus TaxID=42254 RepID=UPI002433A2AA|nr:BRCA2 and CDKN1A-interacting protein [Sorex araneus]
MGWSQAQRDVPSRPPSPPLPFGRSRKSTIPEVGPRRPRRRSGGGNMASRPKRRALGEEAPRTPGAPAPRRDELEDAEAEDDEGDSDREDDSGEEDDSDEDDEAVGEEVNVEFEAYAISDVDYDGIKKLLQQLFLKAPVNTAQLTELLVQQSHVGSVIKQTEVSDDSDGEGDEEEIFGFISLFNLTERKDTQCAEQIKELLLGACRQHGEEGTARQLERLLRDTARPVGLLLSERFLNVPPQVALPMHQQLQKELAEAQRTNKPCGKCHFYLLISKTFVGAGKDGAGKDGAGQRPGGPDKELRFANAEEEFFYEKALLKFSFPVQDGDTCLGGRWAFGDAPLKPLRTVMVVPGDSMGEIMGALQEHLAV